MHTNSPAFELISKKKFIAFSWFAVEMAKHVSITTWLYNVILNSISQSHYIKCTVLWTNEENLYTYVIKFNENIFKNWNLDIKLRCLDTNIVFKALNHENVTCLSTTCLITYSSQTSIQLPFLYYHFLKQKKQKTQW